MNLARVFQSAAGVLPALLPFVVPTVARAGSVSAPLAAPSTRPWLAISDLHYGPGIGGSEPSRLGTDTNDALLNSMLVEAQRVDPDPPVVVIAGDFLAHRFHEDSATATIVSLAKRFDMAFPHAQFLITLGNNDSACGDYVSPIDGPLLAAVARAWAPLVDRNGAAPTFATTFAHDGSYVATLPRAGLHAVVIDDIPFALRYSNACAGDVRAGALDLSEIRERIARFPAGSQSWLLLHVPPGIDAYTTNQLAHHLAVIPFTLPHERKALEAIVEDPKNHVSLAIAGHTHKFAYRVLAGTAKVPLLLVPSVSPVFYNAPSFLTLAVDSHGVVDGAEEHSYNGGTWHSAGTLASLGVHRFDAEQLLALQRRLAKSIDLRARFSRLYSGGGFHEITEDNWRAYWCAATELSASAYQKCEDVHGLSVLTPRGIRFVTDGLVLAAVGIVVAGCAAFFLFQRRNRPARR